MAKKKLEEVDKQLFKLVKAKTVDYDAIGRILSEGANINARMTILEYPKITCLHLAVIKNDMKLVKFLLDHKADIHGRDEDNRTAIHYACGDLIMNNDTIEIGLIKFLLDRGADVNSKTNGDFTPLFIVMDTKRMDLVEFILAEGGEINVITANGSILFKACGLGYDMFKYFLNKGADIREARRLDMHNDKILENFPWTLLHQACKCDEPEIVELLLKRGFDKSAVYTGMDGKTVTPTDLAKSERVKKLLSE